MASRKAHSRWSLSCVKEGRWQSLFPQHFRIVPWDRLLTSDRDTGCHTDTVGMSVLLIPEVETQVGPGLIKLTSVASVANTGWRLLLLAGSSPMNMMQMTKAAKAE